MPTRTAINPEIVVRGVVDDLRAGTAEDLLSGADVVCDGTDNFETRYLVNDWTVRSRIPWVYGGVIGTGGLVMPIVPHETACLACVFETAPEAGSLPTCETAGVLGSAVAVVAGVQTTETVKLLVGARDQLLTGLLRYDGWEGSFTTIGTGGPRPGCPACGERDSRGSKGGAVRARRASAGATRSRSCRGRSRRPRCRRSLRGSEGSGRWW